MLRLTGGEFRGRMIQTPAHTHTRPTQARLRQALFNSLQSEIPEARVLDLFAGSGALGFEALSRGASHITFVENNRSNLKLIEKNATTLDVHNQIQIVGDSVERVVLGDRMMKDAPFDIVLADPPYEEGWELRLLNEARWKELLKVDGYFCLEWGRLKAQVKDLPDRIPFLVKVREKTYGDSVLTTYVRSEV